MEKVDEASNLELSSLTRMMLLGLDWIDSRMSCGCNGEEGKKQERESNKRLPHDKVPRFADRTCRLLLLQSGSAMMSLAYLPIVNRAITSSIHLPAISSFAAHVFHGERSMKGTTLCFQRIGCVHFVSTISRADRKSACRPTM